MFEKFTQIALIALLSLTIGVVAVSVFASMRSNGEVDYCYVNLRAPEGMMPQYLLFGHRPWRQDQHFGAYTTLEEAKSKADLMSCKLNSR